MAKFITLFCTNSTFLIHIGELAEISVFYNMQVCNVVFAMDATTRPKGAARLSEISVNKLSGFF